MKSLKNLWYVPSITNLHIQHLLTSSPHRKRLKARGKIIADNFAIANQQSYNKPSTSLKQRLESLPQELSNEIYNLTFTADPGVREITKTYLPPHLLRVDRASRALFGASYYGNDAVFRISGEDYDSRMDVLDRFVKVFEPRVQHIELLCDYLDGNDDSVHKELCRALHHAIARCAVLKLFDKFGDLETIDLYHRRLHQLEKKLTLVDSGKCREAPVRRLLDQRDESEGGTE